MHPQQSAFFFLHGLIFSILAASLNLPPPAVCHLFALRAFPRSARMRTWISIYMVAVHGAAKTNRINAHHASLCHLWRSSAGPSLVANKLKRGCIYSGILLLFSSVQILQFKQFDIHDNSAPWTTNLQQNITKQTLAPYFSGESFNYLDHCFISSRVVAYLVCFEQVLC